MRKFLASLVTGLVLATSGVIWANSPVRMVVNGNEVIFPDAPPQIINDRTMVPARPLAEALGARVEWDATSRTVLVYAQPPASQTVVQTVTKTVPLSTPHYIIVNDATEMSNDEILEASQYSKGVLIQSGSKIMITSPSDLADYFAKQITLDELVSKSKMYSLDDPASPSAGSAIPYSAPVGTALVIPRGAVLIAENGTFLGDLTSDEFGQRSVCNQFGPHGSKFQTNSIWNEFGNYGGSFGTYSPFNQFSTKPPLIMSEGKVIAKLSVGIVSGAVLNPLGLCKTLKSMGL